MNNIYYKKKWLKNIERVHPPKNEQKVDTRLRLHRAERIYSFPKNFFKNFIDTIIEEDVRYYPYIHDFKEKLASMNNLNSSNIFLNNGSSENIKVFYDAFAIKNKNVIITNPCYPMHKLYALFHQSNIISIDYNKNLNIDYNDILNNINIDTCCIVIANPNSPLGSIINKSDIEKLIKKTFELNIPILIDEAYIEYSDQESCSNLISKYSNLIISRTFSKAYGCAGLRIGYLMGSELIMEVINKFIPTYEITSISAKFGLYILENKKIVNDYIKLIKDEKIILNQLFKRYKIVNYLGNINTIYIKPNNLLKIKNYLIENDILFRTRKLPYDDDEWLAIVLYPEFSKSELFKNIINIHDLKK